MTRRLTILAMLAPFLVVSMSYGQGTIVGTAHDFTEHEWADNQICKPCHTPHHAIAADLSNRLWNHELSVATYETKRGDVTQEEMDQFSRLCLSCHDGTVALDSFGGNINPPSGTMIGSLGDGRRDLGVTLSDDHPVGPASRYNPSAFGGNSYRPVESGGRYGFRVVGSPTIGLLAHPTQPAGTYMISCISCHDVHNGADVDGGVRLLRLSNEGSGLCLSCHIK